MAGGGTSGLSLEHTPTWALAVVCFVFMSVSILLVHSIHLLTNWLKRHQKSALIDAVKKLKSELMLLGFMSLLLAVTQDHTSKICIPAKAADTMLPCRKQENSQSTKIQEYEHLARVTVGSLSTMINNLWRPSRRLEADDDKGSADAGAAYDSCSSVGKVALITTEGLHQLHIFIFVLAVMQIVYCVLTVAMGTAKMRRWEAWEKETQTIEYQVANDPNRFRLARQTSFGRRHMTSCTDTSFQLWIKCFFRQFFRSVAKVDYFTLRHGFISAHLSDGLHGNFDFEKYIRRSLEEDFKAVIGIRPLMWFLVVIFILVDVHGWNVLLWVSYIPLLIVLVLGTKLEVIVARMALQINDRNNVIIGTPLVIPNDSLFWFGRPGFVLTLLHYTLFVNAFDLAFFIWVTIQFGFNSCYHEKTWVTITRIVLGVVVQVLCSYITLPLYALVTQMGSNFKSKVLEEQIANLIRQCHVEVRETRKQQEQLLQSPCSPALSAELSPRRSSPNELSSFLRPTSVASASIRKVEIVEEKQIVKEEAAGSSIRPSRDVILELPTVRRP
ncbi:MLO-like protein 3 [Morella rubra]|uniref:MLO-like protein n=1 Tax=Morella rubra TaxID=262757 RepID=A0A6A1WC05_9ROSI|nr:MLO-like protein 3 [Morella rubra]